MATIQIILGLICLGQGGDALVRGAVGAAERLKISPLVTGLVLVGFGTSMPELATSVVLPIAIPKNVITYDLWILVAVTALLLLAAFTDARLSRREGFLFLVLYAAYLGFLTARASGAI